MIKQTFIFSLFMMGQWCAISDIVLGGWTDMDEQAKNMLSQVLSNEQDPVQVTEGKSQVVAGMNYIVVLEHETAGKCLKAFTHVPFNPENPVVDFQLKELEKNQLLQASGVSECDEEQTRVVLGQLLKKSEDKEEMSQDSMDNISFRSDQEEELLLTKKGGWEDVEEDDLENMQNHFGLSDMDLKLLAAKTQIVAGMNYVFLVQSNDEQPCVVAFNYQSWNKNKLISELSGEMFDLENDFIFTNVKGDSHWDFCDQEQSQNIINYSNLLFTKVAQGEDKSKFFEQLWRDVDLKMFIGISELFGLEQFDLTSGINYFQAQSPRLMFSIKKKDGDTECVFNVTLDGTKKTVTLGEAVSTLTSSIKETKFASLDICDALDLIGAESFGEKVFFQMEEVLFFKEKKELQQLKNTMDFNQWTVMDPEAILNVRQLIDSNDKGLEPVLGMSMPMTSMNYLLIMRNLYFTPCKMSVVYSKMDSITTIEYGDTTEDDYYNGILEDIMPCDDTEIAAFINQSNMRLLI